jgi:hypothetical protein
MCYSLVFPIPASACTAIRESRPLKPRLYRSCTGRQAIRFLESVSAWLLADVHGGGAPAGASFLVAMYVLFLSYFALLLVPYSYLMHVLSLMYVVKYASASIMLFSVIKLTRKFLNNLTYYGRLFHELMAFQIGDQHAQQEVNMSYLLPFCTHPHDNTTRFVV